VERDLAPQPGRDERRAAPTRGTAVSAAKRLASVDNKVMSSSPGVVARTIVKAATASRPKTRYATGAAPGRSWRRAGSLPDRAFDAILARAYLR
jgi:hypothetical protein